MIEFSLGQIFIDRIPNEAQMWCNLKGYMIKNIGKNADGFEQWQIVERPKTEVPSITPEEPEIQPITVKEIKVVRSDFKNPEVNNVTCRNYRKIIYSDGNFEVISQFTREGESSYGWYKYSSFTRIFEQCGQISYLPAPALTVGQYLTFDHTIKLLYSNPGSYVQLDSKCEATSRYHCFQGQLSTFGDEASLFVMCTKDNDAHSENVRYYVKMYYPTLEIS